MKTLNLCLSGLLLAAHTPIYASDDFSYTIDQEAVNEECAFYIDQFGDAHQLVDGNRWIQADLRLRDSGELGDVVLNLGAKVTYIDETSGEKHLEIQPSAPQNASLYIHRIPYQGAELTVRSFNFFVDKRGLDGKITRTWLVDPQHEFTPRNVFFGYPFSYEKVDSSTGITYTLPPSPIMSTKQKCAL